MNLRQRALIVFIILFALIVGVGAYITLNLYQSRDYLKNDVPAAINTLQENSYLDEIAQLIRYDDEVLTQSARNYAFTGDVQWKKRYNEFVIKLDSRIKEALARGDNQDKKFFQEINDANIELVKMEEEAIGLVDKGQLLEAQIILSSQDYLKQKNIYQQGLNQYLTKRGLASDQANEASTNIINQQNKKLLNMVSVSLWSIRLFMILAILLLGILYYVIFYNLIFPLLNLKKATEQISQGDLSKRVEEKSEDEIGKLSHSFNTMIEAIIASREEVDKKVKEQTQEIVADQQDLENQRKAILNILEDVEDEKNLTEQEKEKIGAILQSIGDAVFVVDADLRIILINPVTSLLSGFSENEMLGKKYSEVLKFIYDNENTAKEEINDKFIKKAFETGQIQEMSNHTVLVSKDGKRIPVSDSSAPIKNKNGQIVGCVVVFRDVTKEYQIDKAKTEFVSLASHQLRTPLSAINWYAEMLTNGDVGKLTEDQQKYVDEIYRGNQRMVDLVNALLDVSRIELGTFAITPEETNIVALAKDMVKENNLLAKDKKITITENYDEIPQVSVDPKLMQIIFQNLLSNAVKYTPEKGKVSLTIARKEPNILIEVKDTGYGIPKEQQKNLFQKLFRADNVRAKDTEGTGLGLYIVKAIVDQSGGKISFKSEEDKGTTFYVEIPLRGMPKKEGTKALEDIK